MSTKPQPSGYAIAALVVVAGWAILSSPWLLGDVTIPYDAKAHFQAQIQFLASSLHRGEWPFWTPYVFAGSPQIADPQSLILSPALLIALLDPDPSFRLVDFYAFALLLAGGLSMLMLFRDRGWHPLGAVVAALAFTFGASAAWRIQHIGQIQSYALFGVTMWLLMHALERRSAAWGAAAGAAAALMLVEPDQVAYLASFVLAALVVDHWFGGPEPVWHRFKASLPPLVAASLVGLALIAMPLVMTYLFVERSSRSVISFHEATRGSLHPASLLTLVFSDLYGAHNEAVDYWGPFSETWDPKEITLSQNMSQLYIGALPILLVLGLGFTRRLLWAHDIRATSLAVLAMIVYAVGNHTPVFRLLYDHLPGVDLFRRPADATFLIGALLAIVGGYVTHRWASGTAPPRPGRTSLAIKAAMAATALVTAIAIARAEHHLGVALLPILASLGWLAASLALLAVLARTGHVAGPAGILAVGLLLTADLALNNGPNESTALPRANYAMLDPHAHNPTIELLKAHLAQPAGSPRRDRVELAGLGFEWPNAAMVHRIDHTLGYNPLRLDLFTRAVGAQDSIIGPDQRAFTPLFPSYRCPLADLLGLRFVVTPIPIAKIDRKLKPDDLKLIARTPEGFVYENPRALPRVMFVRDWQQADFAAMLRDGGWPTADPARTVLLDRPPSAAVAAPHEARPATASVQLDAYRNTVVEVAVTAPAAGFVVLNDVWHPWWRVRVDGRPAPMLRANVLFRAVAVAPGTHRVRFEFAPFAGAIEEMRARLSWARDAAAGHR